MRQTATALRLTNHFLARLKERLPGIQTTECELAATLASADWYPGGGQSYYALRRFGGRTIVFVVAVSEGLLDLITLYEPKPGWDRRLGSATPWPMTLVLAASA